MENYKEGKVGLVFAGGGAKGAYQIGVWKALKEKGIQIDAVSGASIGAFNATLFAGNDFEKAENIWVNLTLTKLAKITITFPIAILLNLLLIFGNYWRGYDATNRDRQKPLPLYFSPDLAQKARRMGFLISFTNGAFLIYYTFFVQNVDIQKGYMLIIFIIIIFILIPLLPFCIPHFSIGKHKSLEILIENAINWERIKSSQIPIYVAIAQEVETYFEIEVLAFELSLLKDKSPDRESISLFGDEIEHPLFIKKEGISTGRIIIPTYPKINERPADIARLCLMASMALPVGIFKNIKIGNSFLFDGGVIDNTPLYPFIVERYETIYVVHLRPKGKKRWGEPDEKVRTLWDLLKIERLRLRAGFPTFIDTDSRIHGFSSKIVHIRPRKSLGFSLWGTLYFSKKKAKRLIEQGYQDMIEVLNSQVEIKT